MRETRSWDSRRMRRSEISLEKNQVVWVLMGAIVCLGLAFALGYTAGHRAGQGQGADVIAQAPAPSGDGTTPAKVAAPAPKAGKIVVADDLQFHRQLTGPKATETVTPPSTPMAPQAAPAPVESKPAAGSLREAMSRARHEAHPKGGAKVSPEAVKKALNAGPATSGDYTVQVSAFQSMGEAQAFSSGLERQGYRPFIVTSEIAGKGTWYRVRLGRFSDEATASAAKQVLASAAIPAWVLQAE